MARHGPKIFGIGLHKTGTTSLHRALEHLGYRVMGPFGLHDKDIARTALDRARRLVPRYDAFEDSPWPVLFRDLDARFPGSRFIYTQRDPEPWIASVVGHFQAHPTPMWDYIYGVPYPLGHEDAFLARHAAHERAVFEHFANRPADLLVLRLAHGEGWEPLCAFLGRPVPDVPFPHANPARTTRQKVHRSGVRRLAHALHWRVRRALRDLDRRRRG